MGVTTASAATCDADAAEVDSMNLQTQIARRLFPNEQTFMAKRKLRYVVWAVLVGLVAAGALLGVLILAQNTH